MRERLKELYFQITFNRMIKLERNLNLFLAQRKPVGEVNSLLAQFGEVKKDFRIVTWLKFFVFILMYFSIISLFAKGIPFISDLTGQIASISGFISLPLLTIFLLILEKASNVLIVDAQFIVTRIIALYSK